MLRQSRGFVKRHCFAERRDKMNIWIKLVLLILVAVNITRIFIDRQNRIPDLIYVIAMALEIVLLVFGLIQKQK